MSDLPDPIADRVRALTGVIRRTAPVGGGCIANATRLETPGGTFFLKWSDDEAGRTFEAEAAGLRALRGAASPLVVPEVLAVEDAAEGPGFLLMEWVETGRPNAQFWTAFGEALAVLHRHTEPDERYGFERSNFIGRLPQSNDWRSDWTDFFRSQRLAPQIAMARERGRWRSGWDSLADRLLVRLDDLLPGDPPASVLHGDLWSGNFIATDTGRAALIDPAAYFGHREADLAMTELFGGFDGRFYDAYRAAWPLEPGYEDRREVYNLYHLINHLNHFGAGYAGGVARVLQRFG